MAAVRFVMPNIDAEKLIERLAKGKPVSAVVLLGPDPYLRAVCRQRILDACVPESARAWAVAKIAVEDSGWDEILARAQTMPMLSSRQVILAEGAESFEALGENARDKLLKAFEEYFASPAPFTVLVFETAQLDKRQRFYKLLAEHALLVELALGPESAAALATQMAGELGASIEPAAAAELAEILNGEPARMRVEMEKLAAYAYGRGPIQSADVRALVVNARRNSVWQLSDMLASRQRFAALRFLDNLLREGEEPIAMVGALAWAFRRLIAARELPASTNSYNAARTLGTNPDTAAAFLRSAHQFAKKDLLAVLTALAEADSALKSSHPNPRALMEFLVVRLTA